MAMARESAPVASMNRSASSGSVYRISSEPVSPYLSETPIVPSSASTDTPTAWAARTTREVSAMFSSKGAKDLSIMTEVKPLWIASSTCP